MVRRSRARYLAPIALAAAIAGTYLVVHQALTVKKTTAHTQPADGVRPHGKFARVRFYRVRPGDNLTSIAGRTGIPLTTLEALNPHVDPNALQRGQRLRLRR